MSKLKRYIPDTCESGIGYKDTSANIFESMMLSNAWLDLTSNQKVLYLCCKSQKYSQHSINDEDTKSFYFNRHLWLNKYKLYSASNQRYFYKDMGELILHGFIKCGKCGAVAKEKNIYQLSDKWQVWDTNLFNLDNSELSMSLLNKKYPNKKV